MKKENIRIKGITSAPGKATGIVRIVKAVSDLNKVKAGDIMVVDMSRQDFVPAAKRAAAVVTDEGGIITHVATLAREFSIPCIVGTKIATQVLKDGDKVEVDANKGIVRRV